MSRKGFYLSTVAGIAGLLAAGSASAVTISKSFTNPLSAAFTDIAGYNFSLQKFDSSLGTLNSFVLQITENVHSAYTITANSTSMAVYGLTDYSSALTLPGNGGNSGGNYNLLVSDKIVKTITFATLTTGQVTVAPIASSGAIQGQSVASGGSGTGTVTDSTLLADFTGGASSFINLGFSTNTSTGIQFTGGNDSINQVTSVDVTGSIVYNYTLAPPPAPPGPVGVPEPMTAAVLMAGLAGLAGIRRRR